MLSKAVLAVFLAVCVAAVFGDECDTLAKGGIKTAGDFFLKVHETQDCGKGRSIAKALWYKLKNNGEKFSARTGRDDPDYKNYYANCLMKGFLPYCKGTKKVTCRPQLVKRGAMIISGCYLTTLSYCQIKGCNRY